MVFMRMSRNHDIQFRYFGTLENTVDHIGITLVTAIDQHIVTVTFHQSSIRLSYIYEMDAECRVFRDCGRNYNRRCFRRFRLRSLCFLFRWLCFRSLCFLLGWLCFRSLCFLLGWFCFRSLCFLLGCFCFGGLCLRFGCFRFGGLCLRFGRFCLRHLCINYRRLGFHRFCFIFYREGMIRNNQRCRLIENIIGFKIIITVQ